MPKERLHMLLAQESARLLGSRSYGEAPFLQMAECPFYLIGSISPDVFFYDLPTFTLGHLGSELHRRIGEYGLPFFRHWIDEEGTGMDRDMRAWIFGLAGHYLADGFWHPRIDAEIGSPSHLCKKRRLSARDCHHWLESELEAQWLRLLGPGDGYFEILRQFQRDVRRVEKVVECLRRLLIRAGMTDLPAPKRLSRCIFFQTLLIRQFAEPRWTRWRAWLLALSAGHYLGSLLVPSTPELPALLLRSNEGPSASALTSGEVMAQSITFLAGCLRSLPGPP